MVTDGELLSAGGWTVERLAVDGPDVRCDGEGRGKHDKPDGYGHHGDGEADGHGRELVPRVIPIARDWGVGVTACGLIDN